MAKKKEAEPTGTPEEQQKRAEEMAAMVKAVKLFEKDPLEIAKTPEDRKIIVDYLRKARANIAAVEAAGKRITKKSAAEGAPAAAVNPLEQLAK